MFWLRPTAALCFSALQIRDVAAIESNSEPSLRQALRTGRNALREKHNVRSSKV